MSVYLILQRETGLVKIGFMKSDLPDGLMIRVKELQTGNPFMLVPIGFFPSLGRKAEKAAHRKLSKYRKHGEWFDLPNGMLHEFIHTAFPGSHFFMPNVLPKELGSCEKICEPMGFNFK